MQSQPSNSHDMDKQLRRFASSTLPPQNSASTSSNSSRFNLAPATSVHLTRYAQNNQSGNRKGPHHNGAEVARSSASQRGVIRPHELYASKSEEFALNAAEWGSEHENYSHHLNLNYRHRGHHLQARSGGHQNFQKRYSYYQPKYNKEQFLQANCQFIVKDSGDYAVHHVDPDTLVEWKNIELIKIFSHEEPSCPICLHCPVAAKMTRCGHVYCWPCVLHYLSLSGDKWRKCPICYEAVYAADLKSVVSGSVQPIKAGVDITMRLMVCEKGSAWPFPVGEWTDRKGLFFNVEDEQTLDYSKILLIRPDQIQKEILAREEHELLLALEEEKQSLEACFIEMALKELAGRFAQESPTSGAPTMKPAAASAQTTTGSPTAAHIFKLSKSYQCAFSEEENELEIQAKEEKKEAPVIDVAVSFAEASDAKSVSSVLPDISPRPTGNLAYFYQAADGQHVYLHPLNFRMFIAQYGELRLAPMQFTAKVLEVETFTVTHEFRKRYRYLSHLPLTCVFNIVELELKPPCVSEQVVHAFDKEIQQRERDRQAKMRKETSRQQEAENAFRKDIRGRMTYSFQTEYFPSVAESSSSNLNLESQEAFPVVGSSEILPAVMTSPKPTETEPKSFAKMLREGKVQPQTSRSPPACEPLPVRRNSDSHEDGEEEGYQRAPNFQSTFSAGLDAAFSQLEMEEQNQPASAAEKKSGSKKKRPKNKVLFSTGGMLPRV